MSEFVIRHYVPGTDLSPLARILTEIESVDRDGEDTSEEYLRSMLEWPNFDPDQNVWVVELNGNLAGYGQILPRADNQTTMYIAVHPSQRRNGLGTRLLSLALARAQDVDLKKILVYANGHNLASNAFLKKNGFGVAGTSGVMVAPVAKLPPAEIPGGFTIRRVPELGDPAIVVQALDQCYRNMVGHHQNVTNADRYINYYGRDGIHLLFDSNNSLIGICAAKPGDVVNDRGISDRLDAPGLVMEHRHLGYQRFLALTVMHWLRNQGTLPITLEYWGDDERAIAIYRDIGYELVQQSLTYFRELK
jgi:ribosomal protein S18 acetylase RimI-like enzyme